MADFYLSLIVEKSTRFGLTFRRAGIMIVSPLWHTSDLSWWPRYSARSREFVHSTACSACSRRRCDCKYKSLFSVHFRQRLCVFKIYFVRLSVSWKLIIIFGRRFRTKYTNRNYIVSLLFSVTTCFGQVTGSVQEKLETVQIFQVIFNIVYTFSNNGMWSKMYNNLSQYSTFNS